MKLCKNQPWNLGISYFSNKANWCWEERTTRKCLGITMLPLDSPFRRWGDPEPKSSKNVANLGGPTRQLSRTYLGIRCCPFYGRKICETVINLPFTKVGPDKPMTSQATVSFSQAVHNPSQKNGKQQPLTFPRPPSWHSEAAGETCSLSRTSGWKNWGWKQVMPKIDPAHHQIIESKECMGKCP